MHGGSGVEALSRMRRSPVLRWQEDVGPQWVGNRRGVLKCVQGNDE